MQLVVRYLKLETRSLVPRVWRRLLRWRYLLFQRSRHNRLVLEHVMGRSLLILPGVFNPKLFRTGEFLARLLDERLIPPGATVLDMGTGSGISAIRAAQWAARVVAVDINPAAVRCARINVLLNQVEDRVVVRHGDLFAAVQDERFDVILFNPPYFSGEPKDALDQAFRATNIAERFASELRQHLAASGYALVLLSTDGVLDSFLQTFESHGLAVEVIAERDLLNERLVVYCCRDAETSVRG